MKMTKLISCNNAEMVIVKFYNGTLHKYQYKNTSTENVFETLGEAISNARSLLKKHRIANPVQKKVKRMRKNPVKGHFARKEKGNVWTQLNIGLL